MTPEEMREVLLEEARWWASRDDSQKARQRIALFEQLPEDDSLLVRLSGEYQDASAYRNRAHDLRINPFSLWNMTCNMFQKEAVPPRPDRPPQG